MGIDLSPILLFIPDKIVVVLSCSFLAATPFIWLSIVLFPESTATPTMARQTRATSRSSAGSEGKSAAVAQPDKRLVSVYMITAFEPLL